MRRILSLCILNFVAAGALADSFLIENVRIFNGVDPELTPGHLLVEDGLIATAVSYTHLTLPTIDYTV